MHESIHHYHHHHETLHGFLAYTQPSPQPAVLVIHDWSGQNDFARSQARRMAALGYVGFAVDLYGEGRVGHCVEEKQALMAPLMADRRFLKDRLDAALVAVHKLPMVDAQKIIVIGFCFGGLCALDLARSQAAILGAVSFHGLLHAPPNHTPALIDARIVVFHGYDDPMVTPDGVLEFCHEMNTAQANWQLHMYGHTQHAFMVPEAHDHTLGTVYQPETASRCWNVLDQFLREQFQL